MVGSVTLRCWRVRVEICGRDAENGCNMVGEQRRNKVQGMMHRCSLTEFQGDSGVASQVLEYTAQLTASGNTPDRY